MAIIKVKGSISRVFYEGKGIEVVESYETKTGDTINKRYTVWLKSPTSLDVGDTVQVEGLYSSEIDNWVNKEGEAKQSIKVSINNPQVVPAEPVAIIKGMFEQTHSEPSPF